MTNKKKSERSSQQRRRIFKALPNWFRLKNYGPVRDLDAPEWLQQIYVRQLCFWQLRNMASEERILPEWDDAIKGALSQSRRQPICGPLLPPFNTEVFSWCFNAELVSERGIVHEMTLLDLYKLERNARIWGKLTKEQIEQAERLVSHPSELVFLSLTPSWMGSKLDTEHSSTSNIPLMVDLDFPNSVLIDTFKLQLQRLRRSAKGRFGHARRHMPELTQWVEMGLLPCMDLLLWAEEQQGRLTDRVLADAVAPLDSSNEEKMRKTTRPLAEELLSPGIGASKAFDEFQRSGDLEEFLGNRGIDGHIIIQRLRALAHSDLVQRQQIRNRREGMKL